MMPRYGKDTVVDMGGSQGPDFIYKKWSIGYDTTWYVAHFKVSVHHRMVCVHHKALEKQASTLIILIFSYVSHFPHPYGLSIKGIIMNLVSFNSHSSFTSLHISTKVAIHIFCLWTTYFKSPWILKSPAITQFSYSHHLSRFIHWYYIICTQHTPMYLLLNMSN